MLVRNYVWSCPERLIECLTLWWNIVQLVLLVGGLMQHVTSKGKGYLEKIRVWVSRIVCFSNLYLILPISWIVWNMLLGFRVRLPSIASTLVSPRMTLISGDVKTTIPCQRHEQPICNLEAWGSGLSRKGRRCELSLWGLRNSQWWVSITLVMSLRACFFRQWRWMQGTSIVVLRTCLSIFSMVTIVIW